MTPRQKLVAVRQFLTAPGTVVTAELLHLLADVHLPPQELLGLDDPEAWATQMSDTMAPVSQETALAWLLPAMDAARANAIRVGMAQGRQQVQQDREVQHRALADAVKLVVSLIHRRHIRGVTVRDANDPDNPPQPLLHYLVDALRAAGEDVE
jgi:hypothetical protein